MPLARFCRGVAVAAPGACLPFALQAGALAFRKGPISPCPPSALPGGRGKGAPIPPSFRRRHAGGGEQGEPGPGREAARRPRGAKERKRGQATAVTVPRWPGSVSHAAHGGPCLRAVQMVFQAFIYKPNGSLSSALRNGRQGCCGGRRPAPGSGRQGSLAGRRSRDAPRGRGIGAVAPACGPCCTGAGANQDQDAGRSKRSGPRRSPIRVGSTGSPHRPAPGRGGVPRSPRSRAFSRGGCCDRVCPKNAAATTYAPTLPAPRPCTRGWRGRYRGAPPSGGRPAP